MKSPMLDLLQMLKGFWHSRILFAGQELGVFDFLAQGPKTAAQVAQGLRLDLRGVEILLNALAALELLRKDTERFCVNPAVEDALVAGRPGSQASIIAHHRMMWDSWGHLDETICSGRPWRPPAGSSRTPDSKRVRAFIQGMAEIGQAAARELAGRVDLTHVERVLDVGGGPGTYSIALARRKPTLRATILDLPKPLEVAREYIARSGMQQQVEARKGNALKDDFGSGYDLALVSNLLHSFGPDDNARIVRKSAEALAPQGWLIVNEFALNEDRVSPVSAALFAVNMLANTEQGRTYTVGEIAQWMAEAGLKNIRHEDLLGHSTLTYGQKVAA